LSSQAVARRYASALADVAIERGEQREVLAELQRWSSMIEESEQLGEVVRNPTIPYDQKRNVLEELISRTRIRATTASFLRVLLKNQRLPQLKEIAERFEYVIDERAGIVSGEVTTARPISDKTRAELTEALSIRTGRQVKLTFQIDESIVAGVIARIGSNVLDGSIQHQLERFVAGLSGRRP
jgi:F-type H+-transporting ATPase subunit delta